MKVYADNAATTKVFDEVFDIMKECNKDFYNPSASYGKALQVKKSLDQSRKTLTDLMRGGQGKLYFTSSATESNNTVFFGVHLRKGQTVLISKGEHPAVFNAAHRLEKDGIVVNGKIYEGLGGVNVETKQAKIGDEYYKEYGFYFDLETVTGRK